VSSGIDIEALKASYPWFGEAVSNAGDVLPAPAVLADLSFREIEVLQLVADGLLNREVGERLVIAEETVKSHIKHLLGKLAARSRAHAVAIGFRNGLIV
jgi:DNA-binding NarL/FixJ family response regulator